MVISESDTLSEQRDTYLLRTEGIDVSYLKNNITEYIKCRDVSFAYSSVKGGSLQPFSSGGDAPYGFFSCLHLFELPPDICNTIMGNINPAKVKWIQTEGQKLLSKCAENKTEQISAYKKMLLHAGDF